MPVTTKKTEKIKGYKLIKKTLHLQIKCSDKFYWYNIKKFIHAKTLSSKKYKKYLNKVSNKLGQKFKNYHELEGYLRDNNDCNSDNNTSDADSVGIYQGSDAESFDENIANNKRKKKTKNKPRKRRKRRSSLCTDWWIVNTEDLGYGKIYGTNTDSDSQISVKTTKIENNDDIDDDDDLNINNDSQSDKDMDMNDNSFQNSNINKNSSNVNENKHNTNKNNKIMNNNTSLKNNNNSDSELNTEQSNILNNYNLKELQARFISNEATQETSTQQETQKSIQESHNVTLTQTSKFFADKKKKSENKLKKIDRKKLLKTISRKDVLKILQFKQKQKKALSQ